MDFTLLFQAWAFEKVCYSGVCPQLTKHSTGFVLLFFYTTMANLHFTRLIKAKDKLREFNFRRLPAEGGSLFHVDVSDDRGGRLIFKMQKGGAGSWKVLDDILPAWIYESEDKLAGAIEDQITATQQ